jgi:hypothetical protein
VIPTADSALDVTLETRLDSTLDSTWPFVSKSALQRDRLVTRTELIIPPWAATSAEAAIVRMMEQRMVSRIDCKVDCGFDGWKGRAR